VDYFILFRYFCGLYVDYKQTNEKMASITFRIKDTVANPTNINALMNYKGARVEIATGLMVKKNEWSKPKKNAKPSCKDYDKISQSLRDLKGFFVSEVNEAQNKGTLITKEWLREIPKRCFKQESKDDELAHKIFFVQFIEFFIEKSKTRIVKRTGQPVSTRTIREYQTTLNKIKDFEKKVNRSKPLKLTDIDHDFHERFLTYCQVDLKHKKNTTGKQIDNIKHFCKEAEKLKYSVCTDYKHNDFYSPTNQTDDFALSEEQINAIRNADLRNSEKLSNARDWFIVGIWTGLRVGDLLNLNTENLDGEFIKVTNRKTGYPVVIPIHDDVLAILNKNDKKFPRKISTQKFNDYIKEVAKKAGLTQTVKGSRKVAVKLDENKDKTVQRKITANYPLYELISSHICRRTFATYHYGKLDTLAIMSIIGHTTERQFLEYVKIKPEQHAKAMKAMWKKLKMTLHLSISWQSLSQQKLLKSFYN